MTLPSHILRTTLAALKPFADAVYNDNGDVTITTSHIRTSDYMRARSALEALRASCAEGGGDDKMRDAERRANISLEILKHCYIADDGDGKKYIAVKENIDDIVDAAIERYLRYKSPPTTVPDTVVEAMDFANRETTYLPWETVKERNIRGMQSALEAAHTLGWSLKRDGG